MNLNNNTSNIYQTYSGLKINPFALSSDDIRIVDIAHALSNQCRFTGHVKHFYSVAEHSIACSRLVPDSDSLWALLHDASEAYIQDIASPVKRHEIFDKYRDLEFVIQSTVNRTFDLYGHTPKSVKIADRMMLRREAEYLLSPLNYDVWDRKWLEDIPNADIVVFCWSPKEAEAKFLDRFWECSKLRKKETELISAI